MLLRRALLNAMRIVGGRRPPWIGARAVERLVAGAPVPPEHRRLARLLSAAAGPARGHELASGQAVLDAYVRAGQDHAATVVRPPRVRLLTLSRALAVKVAAVLATGLMGSAALAAQTGHLPAKAQQTAHDLFSSWGVPPPGDGDPPRRDTATRAGESGRTGGTPATTAPTPGGPAAHPPGARPAPPPAGPPATRSPGTTEPDLRNLCNVYLRHRQYPQSRPLTESELRTLATAAGGEANIPAYCARATGTAPAPTRDATPPPGPQRTTPPQHDSGEATRPQTRPTEPPPSTSPPPTGR